MSNDKTKRATTTKADTLLQMLHRKSGASIVEIVKATNWQPHSARAMISGLKKKGYAVAREKVGEVSRYSIVCEVIE